MTEDLKSLSLEFARGLSGQDSYPLPQVTDALSGLERDASSLSQQSRDLVHIVVTAADVTRQVVATSVVVQPRKLRTPGRIQTGVILGELSALVALVLYLFATDTGRLTQVLAVAVLLLRVIQVTLARSADSPPGPRVLSPEEVDVDLQLGARGVESIKQALDSCQNVTASLPTAARSTAATLPDSLVDLFQQLDTTSRFDDESGALNVARSAEQSLAMLGYRLVDPSGVTDNRFEQVVDESLTTPIILSRAVIKEDMVVALGTIATGKDSSR